MLISFENKVAAVTGAAMGMGLAAARMFAEAGAAVVLSDHNAEALQTATDQAGGSRPHSAGRAL